MILKAYIETLGIKGKKKGKYISKTRLVVKCDGDNCDKEWETLWTFRKVRNYDYCQSCKNKIGMCGMLNKKHSENTIKIFKDGRRAGDNNVSKREDVKKKISEKLKGRECPWSKGKKRPEHSKLMKQRMRESWENMSTEERQLRGDIVSKNFRTGRISKLHKDVHHEINKIINFEMESLICGLWVDEINYDLNIIVEVNGDYWHCNPRKYKLSDKVKFPGEIKMVEEVWERDKKRNGTLKENGYCVFVVWEYDWNNNKEKVIKELEKFINENSNNC